MFVTIPLSAEGWHGEEHNSPGSPSAAAAPLLSLFSYVRLPRWMPLLRKPPYGHPANFTWPFTVFLSLLLYYVTTAIYIYIYIYTYRYTIHICVALYTRMPIIHVFDAHTSTYNYIELFIQISFIPFHTLHIQELSILFLNIPTPFTTLLSVGVYKTADKAPEVPIKLLQKND